MPVSVLEYPFPDSIAILPSGAHIFDYSGTDTLSMRIAGRKTLSNGVEVLATECGVLAYDFSGSDLGGARRLVARGSGEVPVEVAANETALIELQINRLRHAVFVASCVFGVNASRTHSSVAKPLLPGLDEVYGWSAEGGDRIRMAPADAQRLALNLGQERAIATANRSPSASISIEYLTQGLNLADRVLMSRTVYREIDPVSVLVMAYQAMVLHGHQHAGASIALSAVVIEAVVGELMFACGLVSGVSCRLPTFNRSSAGAAKFSRSQLRKLGFNGKLQALADAGAADHNLVQRIEAARDARNSLMHEVLDASPRQAGDGLTAVRDLLRLCFDEADLDFTTSWSFRL